MTDFEFTVFLIVLASMFAFTPLAVAFINREFIATWIAVQAYNLRSWLRGIPDRFCIWLAWHVLPKRLVMWCCIRVGAWATTGAYSSQLVPALTFVEALKRWETA